VKKVTALIICTIVLLSTSASADPYRVNPTVILESMASDARFGRKLGGGMLVGLGALTFLAFSDDTEDSYYYTEPQTDTTDALVFGGVFAGLGLGLLLMESHPERAWNRVEEISDPQAQRERAYTEIVDLAAQMKTNRIIGGFTQLGLAAMFASDDLFATDDNVNSTSYLALPHLIFGISSFLVPSRAERALESLDKNTVFQSHNNLNFGVALDKTPKLALNFTF